MIIIINTPYYITAREELNVTDQHGPPSVRHAFAYQNHDSS